MAEKIVSPGVFQNENDQSFIAQGVADLGAVVVGPTQKGPAYIPTVIRNGYNEFVVKFGSDTSNNYTSYAVQDYLSKASSVTVVRVLGNGGWNFTTTRQLVGLAISGSGVETSGYANTLLAVFHPSEFSSPNSLGLERTTIDIISGSITGSFVLGFSGSGFTSVQPVSASFVKTSPNFITKTIGSNENNSLTGSTNRTFAFPYILFKDLANSSPITTLR